MDRDRANLIGLGVALAVVLVALVGTAFADPWTCNAGGCTWNSKYTEPSTLTNGQPLTDLADCTASYTTSVDGNPPGPAKTFVIAATRPTGGQLAQKLNTDATMIPPHTYTVTETVACRSTSLGTGAASAPASLLMNNGVAPSGVTLTLE